MSDAVSEWAVELDGVRLGGCDDDTAPGMLSYPPDGLGLPELRTEDVTYPQRDGVRHFSDWYGPRIITLKEVTVCPDENCGNCLSAREKLRDITKAWSRKCDDVELVIRTDCDPGPYAGRVNLAVTSQPDPAWATLPPVPTVLSGTWPRPNVWVVQGTTDEPAYSTDAPLPDPGIKAFMRVNHNPAGQTLVQYVGVPEQYRGATAAVSIWVRSPVVAGSVNWSVVTLSGLWGNQTVALPADQWVRLSMTGAIATTDAVIAPQLGVATGGSMGALDVTGLLVEPMTSTVGTYIDGSSGAVWTGDGGLGYSGLGIGTGSPYSSTSAVGPDRALVGPFGVIGRPRVMQSVWERGTSGCVTLTMRFDAVDHRMYVLDASGAPGSGVRSVTVYPTTSSLARCYPKCYPKCYDTPTGASAGDGTALVIGTECVYPTVCFHGQLTQPVLENVTTGSIMGYAGSISQSAAEVCVDTESGSADQGGAGRTYLITGDPHFTLAPGDNLLRLTSQSSSDDGYVTVSYRSVVISA